jgi:hypothetical protein
MACTIDTRLMLASKGSLLGQAVCDIKGEVELSWPFRRYRSNLSR